MNTLTQYVPRQDYRHIVTNKWEVPSAHVPGDYYTVVIHANGATECNCRWGSSADAPTRCWHAHLVLLLEEPEVRELVGDLRYSRDALRAGNIVAQAQALSAVIEQLARQDALHTAHRAASVLAKYLQALSVQGAGKPATEPATNEQEAAVLAAPSEY